MNPKQIMEKNRLIRDISSRVLVPAWMLDNILELYYIVENEGLPYYQQHWPYAKAQVEVRYGRMDA